MRPAAVRVTLDTNVYVSAFQFGGMRLLHMALDAHLEIAVSEPILDEVIRVLRDKFQWDGYRLHEARQQILLLARMVMPGQTLDVVKEDEPDNRILECAVAAGSQFIITADRDLLRLEIYGDISIIRPADFLQRHVDPQDPAQRP
ncbi:MAG TPA: putative toxin-antitoxin system toxin component, PIN family [Bryobacteraceae bacterium]|nr:putative toxin-antitoxin system toxin component, PIN family [Bryobacteraceae bacterium]